MDPAQEPPSALRRLFGTTQDRQSLCVLAVLNWIAACDGFVAPLEQELLEKVADAMGGGEELLAAVEVARLGRVEDLEFACRFLSTRVDRSARKLLAQLAVTMAVQDGQLTVGENHVLQFLADLLGIRPRTFARLFQKLTHRPFPEPGDPSSPAWWRHRAVGEQAHAPADGWGPEPTGADAEPREQPMTRTQALRLLGLGREAGGEQIHAAYRRLAKVRHPDRFAPLGPVAIATATAAFQRLGAAYEAALAGAGMRHAAPARSEAT